MSNKTANNSRKGSFFAGLLMGSLAGAALAYIFAPQSGTNAKGQMTDFVKRTEGATAPHQHAAVNGSSNGRHPSQDDAEEQTRIILDKGKTPTTTDEEESPD